MNLLRTATAVFLITAAPAFAATEPSALGPEAAMAKPANGFVGKMTVAPLHGPVGTPVYDQRLIESEPITWM